METQAYSDFEGFCKKAIPFLQVNEAENNMALGMLHAQKNRKPNPEHQFLITEMKGKIALVIVHTGKRTVVCGQLEAIPSAVEFLTNAKTDIKILLARKDLGLTFLKEWETKTGQKGAVSMNHRIFRLDSLKEIRKASGRIRPATEADAATLIPWIREFFREIGENLQSEKAEKFFARAISKKTLYVWENGEVVSMVQKERETGNGAVISAVFTPPEHRKKGYASTCVHAFSKLLLQNFKFCALYTDLANPTSNKIYQFIGYQPVVDASVITFS